MATKRQTAAGILSAQLNGTFVPLGVIAATTTKNNHDTAAPFNSTADALKGKLLLIQADVACYVALGTTNAITATTASLYIPALGSRTISMENGYGWIACVSTAATNLRVWELI